MADIDEEEKEDIVNLIENDEKSQWVLELMYESEGKANYSEIRSTTGLNRTNAGNTIRKLEERLELITQIGYDEDAKQGNRSAPRLFKLTDLAVDLIKSGDLLGNKLYEEKDEKDIPQSVRKQKERLEEMRNRLNRIENRQKLLQATGQQEDESEIVSKIAEKVIEEIDTNYVKQEPMQEYLKAIDIALRDLTGKGINDLRDEIDQEKEDVV